MQCFPHPPFWREPPDVTAQVPLPGQLPTPQRLALTYATTRTRPAFLALFLLDTRFAAILRGKREPIAAQLRLAWWRDVLAKPADQRPIGEPAVEALAAWRDPSGLAVLASGWEALLSEELSPDVIAEFAGARGASFALLAEELGVARPKEAATAGEIWALADLAANVAPGEEKALVVEYGRTRLPPPRLPAPLRPLAVLAGLGEAALRRGGLPLLSGPRSTLLALRIGLSGR